MVLGLLNQLHHKMPARSGSMVSGATERSSATTVVADIGERHRHRMAI